jgi:hypothetical protein
MKTFCFVCPSNIGSQNRILYAAFFCYSVFVLLLILLVINRSSFKSSHQPLFICIKNIFVHEILGFAATYWYCVSYCLLPNTLTVQFQRTVPQLFIIFSLHILFWQFGGEGEVGGGGEEGESIYLVHSISVEWTHTFYNLHTPKFCIYIRPVVRGRGGHSRETKIVTGTCTDVGEFSKCTKLQKYTFRNINYA